jgi:hypothetical protein
MTTKTDRDAGSAAPYDLRRHVSHLYGMGRRFCDAAAQPVGQAVSEHAFQNTHWGLELVLKAFLVDRGWTDERCRTTVRHDIALALAACEEEGLAGVEEASRALVQALSPFSERRQVAEFVEGGAKGFTSKHAIAAAENIVTAVRQALDSRPEGERLPLRPSLSSRPTPSAGTPRNAPRGRGPRLTP